MFFCIKSHSDLTAKTFPGQVALGLDAKNGFVATRGWAEETDMQVTDLAKAFEDAGIAAIIYTDIDRDGAMGGPNILATEALARAVDVPVIASGGVGNLDHLVDGIQEGGATAVLAASIFHFGTYTIAEAKAHMAKAGVPVRLT